jgi:hypothetical protein
MEQEVCHGEKAVYAGDLTRESPVLDVWKGYLKVHLIPEATESSVARFKGIFEKHVMPSWRDLVAIVAGVTFTGDNLGRSSSVT